MDIYKMSETSYKNGYAQGMKDALCAITRCKGCSHSDTIDCSEGMVWCNRIRTYMKEDGFCSFGERKDNG